MKEFPIPNLQYSQDKSFGRFLQQDRTEGRGYFGLQSNLLQTLSLKTADNRIRVGFLKYTCLQPKISEGEARKYGLTYTISLYLHFKIIIKEGPIILSEEEECIFLGDLPALTKIGSFILNGTDKAPISQLERKPGLYIEKEDGSSASTIFLRIVPPMGLWIEFKVEKDGTICCYHGKKRKPLIGSVLEESSQNITAFWDNMNPGETVFITRTRCFLNLDPWELENNKAPTNIKDLEDPNTIIFPKGIKMIQNNVLNLLQSNIFVSQILPDEIFELAPQVLPNVIKLCSEQKLNRIKIKRQQLNLYQRFLTETMNLRKTITNLNSGINEASDQERERTPFPNAFGSPMHNLSENCRQSINSKTYQITKSKSVEKADVYLLVKLLIKTAINKPVLDDVDNLKNKRLSQTGDLISKLLNTIIFRLKYKILEDIKTLTNSKKLKPTINGLNDNENNITKIFSAEQTFQLLEHTNPLSRLTHIRRLSFGLSSASNKKRVGLDIRDVHYSYYSKICPVETPEGQSIGLVNSLTSHVRINSDGTLMASYLKPKRSDAINSLIDYEVENDNIIFLSACEEEQYILSGILSQTSELKRRVLSRKGSETILSDQNDVQLIDASPSQTVSAAASLIPFLEHNDVNRALMGSNMQRQVVPLFLTEKPIIQTGTENAIARDTGSCTIAIENGKVVFSGHNRIVTKSRKFGNFYQHFHNYNLEYFVDPLHSITTHLSALIEVNSQAHQDGIIADGPATKSGVLSLGQNILVAFMPWKGLNFEDSVIVSKELIINKKYVSVHLEEIVVAVQDSEFGVEITTKDIRNSKHANLDCNGIILVGSDVRPGDLIIGKQFTKKKRFINQPEKDILQAIFNYESTNITDTSVFAPQDFVGTVIDVKIQTKIFSQDEKLCFSISNQDLLFKLAQQELEVFSIIKIHLIKLGLDFVQLKKMDPYKWVILCGRSPTFKSYANALTSLLSFQQKIRAEMRAKKKNKMAVEKLPTSISKLIKIILASERQLQTGDKMAGRYGNKGVVSKIVAAENMPHLITGQSIEIVLNPLGVPSRMNVGQIFETHISFLIKINEMRIVRKKMDWVGRCAINWYREASCQLKQNNLWDLRNLISSPSFATLEIPAIKIFNQNENEKLLFNLRQSISFKVEKRLGCSHLKDQVFLIDGTSGEECYLPTTIGYLYYFKLHHLAEDKMHVRSTGPYSKMTQQPLAGKSHAGGQRLGEMEVWALEAYGAAYNLHEMLTIKSDDVWGRSKMQKGGVISNQPLLTGMPESFNVLIKEAKALNIDLTPNPKEG
ncbi:DNA-directed RNA polymerase subunit beta [Candidatus Tremblaya phenacola PAVE]|nr:DNA-directed RNA polymerase subunit beta [Candidatus Tremblaya phenacola PAVE]